MADPLCPIDDRLRGWPMVSSRISESASYQSMEREALLRQAVSRLPELYRRVVDLCDLQQLSLQEAATRLRSTLWPHREINPSTSVTFSWVVSAALQSQSSSIYPLAIGIEMSRPAGRIEIYPRVCMSKSRHLMATNSFAELRSTTDSRPAPKSAEVPLRISPSRLWCSRGALHS